MRHFSAFVFGCILMLATTVQPARSSTLWGTHTGLDLSSTITGSIYGSDLSYTGTIWDDFELSWNISQATDGIWEYTYSWSGSDKAVSHFILEVTAGSFDIGTDSYSTISDPTVYSNSANKNPNPGSFADFYGIKFDETGSVSEVTLYTIHAPVWGNFYVKAGSGNGAWNTALDSADYATNTALTTSAFIVRPNGAVPIPGSILLLGSGFVAVAGLRIRKLSGTA